MLNKWSPEEEIYLREAYGKIPTKEIAEKLGRSLVSTRRKIDNSGLRGNKRIEWTKAELDIIYSNLDKKATEVALLLPDRPHVSVRKRLEGAQRARKTISENLNP